MTAEQTITMIRAALAAYDAAQAPSPAFIIVLGPADVRREVVTPVRVQLAVTATKTTKAKALKPAASAKRKRATPGRHQFETFVPRSSS